MATPSYHHDHSIMRSARQSVIRTCRNWKPISRHMTLKLNRQPLLIWCLLCFSIIVLLNLKESILQRFGGARFQQQTVYACSTRSAHKIGYQQFCRVCCIYLLISYCYSLSNFQIFLWRLPQYFSEMHILQLISVSDLKPHRILPDSLVIWVNS